MKPPQLNLTDPLISIKRLSFAFNSTQVLDDVSWQVQAGDFWVICGPNGAGKTTLLRCLAGIFKVPAATIFLGQKDLVYMTQPERVGYIGYVPQRILFTQAFTVKEVLFLSRYVHGPAAADSALYQETLHLFQLEALEYRFVHQLSGGEMQKVLLAGAYMLNSRVLVLDEPFSYLDPRQTQEVWSILEQIVAHKKITLIMVLNQLSNFFLSPLSDSAKVLMLDHQVVAQGLFRDRIDWLEKLYGKKFEVFTSKKRQVFL
jgi:iron complex transport system ATP-binding protein